VVDQVEEESYSTDTKQVEQEIHHQFSPPQGNNGGDGNPGPQPVTGGEGGGGGGAGAVGTNAGPCAAGWWSWIFFC
jgi:hypothetical protein